MKKLIIIPILIAISAILVFLIYQNQQASELPEDVIYSSGTVEANDVDVSAQISARVIAKRFSKGALVEQGDTLFTLDSELLETRLEELDAGEAAVKSEIRAAQTELRNLQTNLDRMKQAYEVGSVPKSKLDDLETAYESGSTRLESLRAKLDQIAAQRKTIGVQMSYCTVTAPVSGTVQADPVSEGEIAVAGTALAQIVNLDDVWIEIYVNETDLPRIELGENAEVHLDAFPDQQFTGTVSFISQKAEFTPKNVQTKKERVKLVFAVRVQVDNEGHVFKPGLPADVYLEKR